MHRNINIAVIGSGPGNNALVKALIHHFDLHKNFTTHVHVHDPKEPQSPTDILLSDEEVLRYKHRFVIHQTLEHVFDAQNGVELLLIAPESDLEIPLKNFVKKMNGHNPVQRIPVGVLISDENDSHEATRSFAYGHLIKDMLLSQHVFPVHFKLLSEKPYIKIDPGKLQINSNLHRQKAFFRKINAYVVPNHRKQRLLVKK